MKSIIMKVVTSLLVFVSIFGVLFYSSSVVVQANTVRKEKVQQEKNVGTEENSIVGGLLYEGKNGIIYTENEIKLMQPTTRTLTGGFVVIGIYNKYTSKSDGKKLKGIYNTAANTAGGVSVIFGVVSAAGILGGGLAGVIGYFNSLGAGHVRGLFKKATTSVSNHISGGVVTIYLDHVTWKKL